MDDFELVLSELQQSGPKSILIGKFTENLTFIIDETPIDYDTSPPLFSSGEALKDYLATISNYSQKYQINQAQRLIYENYFGTKQVNVGYRYKILSFFAIFCT